MGKSSIGVIGVGAMGMGVAKTLLRNGYAVAVRDILPQRQEEAVAAGAIACHSPRAMAQRCDTIITLVLDDRQTEEVLFGADGAIHGLRPDAVVIVSSTLAPETLEAVAERLNTRGVGVLDAPVSGGPAKALAGEMSMMLAGADAVYARIEPLLSAIAGKVIRVSERPGDGARMKLVNNMMAGVNLAAGCEAMALGMKLGLDPKMIFDVVCASSGASWVVADRMPRFFAGDFAPRAATSVLTKDLSLGLKAAAQAGVDTPIAKSAHAAFQNAVELGLGAEDDAALIKPLLEPGFGIQD